MQDGEIHNAKIINKSIIKKINVQVSDKEQWQLLWQHSVSVNLASHPTQCKSSKDRNNRISQLQN